MVFFLLECVIFDMDSTDEMETNNYLQLSCRFMIELFIGVPLKMVKYKDLTENKWKTSQCSKKHYDRSSESLEKYWLLEAKYRKNEE